MRDAGVSVGETTDLLTQAAQGAFDQLVEIAVRIGVGSQRFSEIVDDAVMVDDQPVALSCCGAVDAGDGLQ